MAKRVKKEAKKEVKKEVKQFAGIPTEMKCFQKVGGGSLRFENRIIKSGQKFWIQPHLVPNAFKDLINEVAADNGAVVINAISSYKFQNEQDGELLLEKFRLEKALDENDEVIMKADSALYNVVGADNKPLNEKPLRKNKAEELLETLNV